MRDLLARLLIFPFVVWLASMVAPKIGLPHFAGVLGVAWGTALIAYAGEIYLGRLVILHDGPIYWQIISKIVLLTAAFAFFTSLVRGAFLSFWGAFMAGIFLTAADYLSLYLPRLARDITPGNRGE